MSDKKLSRDSTITKLLAVFILIVMTVIFFYITAGFALLGFSAWQDGSKLLGVLFLSSSLMLFFAAVNRK